MEKPRITLKIDAGPLAGQKYSVDKCMSVVIGRAEDCMLRIPVEADNKISRYHCLLDVNPPVAMIKDLCSKNGTYVNSKKIAQEGDAACYRLKDGDKIEIGDTGFMVRIFAPMICKDCSREISAEEADKSRMGEYEYRCPECKVKLDTALSKEEEPKKFFCCKCGEEMFFEPGKEPSGDSECMRCKSQTQFVINRILGKEETRFNPQWPKIEGYQIVKELSSRPYITVYLAKDIKTGTEVVIKKLTSQAHVVSAAKNQFVREMTLLEMLKHPNIIRILKANFDEKLLYYVCEYYDYGSLEYQIRFSGRTLTFPETKNIILLILKGLEYAHNINFIDLKNENDEAVNGIIHHDLKPSNILLGDEDGLSTVKIANFGLARARNLAGYTTFTMPEDVNVNPYFMPRQQVLDIKRSGFGIDIWAVAGILYYMLTGTPPRNFPVEKDPLKMILDTDPIPILKRNPEVPEEAALFIDRVLYDRDGLFYENVQDFRKDFEAVVDLYSNQ